MTDSPSGFGIYIHWPFCSAKCPYCDFNSHVSHDPIDQHRFATGFITELSHWLHHSSFSPPANLRSIFIGGGTPSLMEPSTVELLLTEIDHHWSLTDTIEITMEANPTSIESARFRAYKALGVNRISIGVQSLIDEQLKFLGRLHTARQALESIELAHTLFPSFSFDLIYARPHQTPDEWHKELEQALGLGSPHLSLYQLTIEPNTPFYDLHHRGKLTIPDSDSSAELYTLTESLTASYGLMNYEVSNYCVSGYESVHNLLYWRSGDWLGLGPGAHSRLTMSDGRHAIINLSSPSGWLSGVESTGIAIESDECLSFDSVAHEFLLMGLRLREGIDLSRFSLCEKKIDNLVAMNMLERFGSGRIRTTFQGRLLLDTILGELVL